MAPSKLIRGSGVEFLDIRRETEEQSLLQATLTGLANKVGRSRSLPTLLLYDEKGLKIFEQITYLEEYYLTNDEIEVLQKHAIDIVERTREGTLLVEFGSGNLRKVEILLNAFEKAGKKVDYYALDLSLPELERTFSKISTADFLHVGFHALHGTYEDGIAWLSGLQDRGIPICALTLGSSLGNFDRDEGARFLASISAVLGPGDLLLVGLDGCQNPSKILKAYNDSKGVTERFYRNGLERANRLIGSAVFVQDEWIVEGIYNESIGRHEAAYVASTDISRFGFTFEKGEKLGFEWAFKYSTKQAEKLWRSAGLILQNSYGESQYHVHLLTPSRIGFDTRPSQYAAQPIPSEKDWAQLWAAWDTVTRAMVPQDELLNKPIKLRNNLIFYLGHIPAFADIHFTRATDTPPTDPAYYHTIFERGIDPDVDNPEVCHAHSELPDSWPPLEEMLGYQVRVRNRIIKSITSGQASADRKLARSLWLAFEHEAMHLETFCYMLLQSERILAPPGHATPDFRAMAASAANNRSQNEWHQIPPSEIILGMDDPENNEGPDRYFGWDNERPARTVKVGSFKAQSRPISIGEYAQFLEETGFEFLPSSWSTKFSSNGSSAISNGVLLDGSPFLKNKYIRTVFGLVPLEFALDWPIMTSYDELASFARWSGGRIPTFEEIKSIHRYVVDMKQKEMVNANSSLISAVNGHLVNDGVEESPPSNGNRPILSSAVNADAETVENGRQLNPDDLHIDLTGANVGFSHWHPTPVTGDGSRLRGQSDMGGLWEWTSTALASHPGFKAMDLYPGYTADFFDGKHNIILGGSWATVPRIAGRKSFVNWYQRNYPFTWATARLVRDD